MDNLPESIENEWYAIRYSGEIPEIAFHSAIHHLCHDQQGPGLKLAPNHLQRLREAAVIRYLEIVGRDLLHANADLPIYRGIRRAAINWQRFVRFCHRQGLDETLHKQMVAETLTDFLSRELLLVEDEKRPSIINCEFAELSRFVNDTGAVWPRPPELFAALCTKDG